MKRFIIFALVGILVVSLFGVNSAWASDKGFQVNCEFENNEVILTWEAVDGASYYHVFRGVSENTVSETPLTDFPITKTNYYDSWMYQDIKTAVYVVCAYDSEMVMVAKSSPLYFEEEYGKHVNINITFKLGESKYIVNGIEKEMDGEVKSFGGKVYVPYKVLPNELSCASKWVWTEDKEQELIITNHTDYFHMIVGSNIAKINDDVIQIDENDTRVYPKEIDDMLYIPLRFTVTILDAKEIKFLPANTEIKLLFDKPADDREGYYERKVRIRNDLSAVEIDDAPTNKKAQIISKNGSYYLPIEDILLAFGFDTSWECDKKLVFYKWKYKDPNKSVVQAGYYIDGEDFFVVDGRQVQMSDRAFVREGKMYVAPNGFYKIGPMTNIHWSASDVRLWLWVPRQSHALTEPKKPHTREVSMWAVTEDRNQDKAGQIAVDDVLYKSPSEIMKLDGITCIPIGTVLNAFGAVLSWGNDKKVLSVELDTFYYDGEETTINARFEVGNKTLKIDGQEFEMIKAPEIVNEELYVPIRVLSERFSVETSVNLASESVIDRIYWQLRVPIDSPINLEKFE